MNGRTLIFHIQSVKLKKEEKIVNIAHTDAEATYERLYSFIFMNDEFLVHTYNRNSRIASKKSF